MCEINFIYGLGTSRLGKRQFNHFSQMMIASATRNKDGAGYCNENMLFKSVERDFKPGFLAEDRIKNKKFVLGHARWATKGTINSENTQPLQIGNLVLAHNGSISEYGNETRSDSYKLLLTIENSFNQGKTLIEAVKIALKDKVFYSVFIYNTATQEMFYCKDGATHFNFNLVQDGEKYYIYGATRKQNMKLTAKITKFGFPIGFKLKVVGSISPESRKIYSIDREGIKETGETIEYALKFEDSTQVVFQSKGYNKRAKNRKSYVGYTSETGKIIYDYGEDGYKTLDEGYKFERE